jgi:hypothetical protein
LALAGVDVVVVERRAGEEIIARAQAVSTLEGQVAEVARVSPGSLWTSAIFPPGTTTGSGCCRNISSAFWAPGSASWRCGSIVDLK